MKKYYEKDAFNSQKLSLAWYHIRTYWNLYDIYIYVLMEPMEGTGGLQ